MTKLTQEQFNAACDKTIKGFKVPEGFHNGDAVNLGRDFAVALTKQLETPVSVQSIPKADSPHTTVTATCGEFEPFKAVINYGPKKPTKTKTKE